MKTLCFGGSFNPIHHGHLICARAVAEAAGFGRILLIPSANPPHKARHGDIASASHRLAMCQIVVAQQPELFAVNDLELRRGQRPSYTLETVIQLKADGMDPVWWLLGADALKLLPTWHKPRQLLAEVNFVVMGRPGTRWPKLPRPFDRLRRSVVRAPLIDISASQIRQRVRQGLSIEFLTPPAVADYIAAQGLYRD